MAEDTISKDGKIRRGELHRFVWRWHFYAGLVTAPFLIILALTGALYLFNHEIENWWYRNLVEVPPYAQMAPASVQEALVLRAYPTARIRSYALPLDNHHAAEWTVSVPGGKPLVVFVNPARPAITGAISADTRLMQVIRNLHARLLFGEPGRYVMELAACWGFVLLVTGLFLWWPRRVRMEGVVAPRLRARGRIFWKDLHAVPSMWNAGVIAFLILTGLPWSVFWGQQLERIGGVTSLAAPSPQFSPRFKLPSPAGAPATMDMDAHADHKGAADLPWALRDAPQPHVAPHVMRISVDDVLAEAKKRRISGPGLRVLYPNSPYDTFVLSFVPHKAQSQRNVSIDPGTGAVVRDLGWPTYSPVAKIVEFGVMTHMGEEFGLANQVILFCCCILFVMTISFGVVMWWRRRPPGRLGAPGGREDFSPSVAVVVTAVLLGISFPLAGASMILILGVEGWMRLRTDQTQTR